MKPVASGGAGAPLKLRPFARLAPADLPPDDADDDGVGLGEVGQCDVLPYRVELWDDAGECVEQVIALSRTRYLGWVAYFAAAEQFPDRLITLRNEFSELGRWSRKRH